MLLQTQRCGAFIPDRARVLVNAQATTAAVTRALRSFLKDASEDDLVLLYFSGHGAIDRKNRKQKDIAYFLTHDTDPEDISGTALPMREIMQSLDENVRARRVIMMMDTCHSAAVGGGKGAPAADPIVLEQYLAKLARSEEGFALLTSSEVDEQSREDACWGEGHGLFTHLVLEGLRGKADTDGNGVVTVGELFDYVVKQTEARGGPGAQHPRQGLRAFDRDFPLAITGGIDARNRLDLGRALLEMAIECNDRRRFASAARHLEDADDRAGLEGGLAEARMFAGVARLGAGEIDAGCKNLRMALEGGRKAIAAGRVGCPDAGYYLGVALAMRGARVEAADAFEAFAREDPENPRACLAVSLRAGLLNVAPASTPHGRLRALLIGVGRFCHLQGRDLRGPVNDLQLLQDVLRRPDSAGADEIVCLLDEEATHERVSQELDRLRGSAPDDRVLVSFSGHAATDALDDAYLMLFDTHRAPNDTPRAPDAGWVHAFGAAQLDAALDAIPARSKLAVLDTHAHPRFVELARRASCSYSVLLAARVGMAAYEISYDANGQEKYAGLLTHVLVQILAALGLNESWEEILPRVVEGVKIRQANQSPLLLGGENVRFLGERRSDPAALLEMSIFGERRARSASQLEDWYEAATRDIVELGLGSFPDLHLAFGRALATASAPRAAARALSRARDESIRGVERAGDDITATHPVVAGVTTTIAWYRTWVELQQHAFDRAAAAFDELATSVDASERSKWRERFDAFVTELRDRRPRALIVGIDRYSDPGVGGLQDAVIDARSVRDMLLDHCGLAEADVTVLEDDQATAERFIDAFRALASASHHGPALFYFAGQGSFERHAGPTILSSDARQADVLDISLDRLAALANNANLVSILDTDHQPMAARDIAHDSPARFVLPDLRSAGSTRDVTPRAVIGRVEIAARNGHRITQQLVEALRRGDPATLSCIEWAGELDSAGRLELAGASFDEPVFHDPDMHARIVSFLHRHRPSSWIAAIAVLGAMIDDAQGRETQDWLVDLGTTHVLLGDLEQAMAALKAAIARSADGRCAEASFHLGRVLLTMGKDLARAKSELEAAEEAYPDDPAVQYYLGLSIRMFFEKESLEKARSAWGKYLEAGAPLGHRAEVETFLRSTATTS